MWKVLIADDEPKIRRGIRNLIERSSPELEVVAEAEDGEVALEKTNKFEPDILFIDVRMPFLNGLELIEKLNTTCLDRIIIIISGHDEFEYAQRALQLKVFDYLLKPVAPELFRSVIDKAISELRLRRESDRYLSWAKAQLGKSLPVLREKFFRSWIAGNLSRTEIDESLDFLSVPLPERCTLFSARFVERFTGGIGGAETSRRFLLVAMRSIVEEALASIPNSFVFEDDTETVLAIVPELEERPLLALKDEIERKADTSMHQVVVVASRRVENPVEGLPDAYEELVLELSDGGNCEVFVILARNYIDKQYWRPGLSLEEVAEELQISPGYLSRLLKRETGFSFMEYLTRFRVKKATQLMNDPAAKIFEIAERTGYRSQHYFSRAFKKVLGISPSEYRKGSTHDPA